MAAQNQVSLQPFLISSITSLTVSNFSQQILCTGASAYAVTLPSVSGNGGRFIDFSIFTTSNALITITPASGTIQGQSTFILGSGESCSVYCDGTNWWIENLVLQPVYCLVSMLTTPTLSGSQQIIPFDNAQLDLGSFFDTSTHIYTPLYPGKYKVSCNNNVNYPTSVTGQTTVDIFQTAGINRSIQTLPAAASSGGILSFSPEAILNFNGTTDNCNFNITAPSTCTLNADSAGAYFNYATFERISNI